MGEPITIDLDIIFYILLGLFSSGILFTALLFFWVIWRVKRIQIPQNADFFTTMRATPLSVAILLDLLDFTFDIFSIPFCLDLVRLSGTSAIKNGNSCRSCNSRHTDYPHTYDCLVDRPFFQSHPD
jgi:hypothetical protein